jgi:DNA topoisomerase-1
LAADSKAAGEEILLPKLTAGEKLTLITINSLGKQTEGPARYSEAGLVKELEKRGIGRPSTYASTIKTIQDRGYAEKVERAIKPTETGEVVSDFLDRYFHDYISDEFTAKLEDELDLIAEHKRSYAQVLSDFYIPFQKTVASKANIPKLSDLGQADVSIVCPLCGGGMIIKLSRSGRFFSCARFPDCAGARKIDGTVMEPPKDLGLPCPDCTEGKLVEREGRFGKFVSCSRYPKCKYVKKDENGGAGGAGDTGVACPLCSQGSMVEKRGRFGIFYGCSHYPKCKNIIKTKPTGKLCSFIRDNGQPCGHLMMAGTKRIPDRCSDKTCPNHNPHKLPATT